MKKISVILLCLFVSISISYSIDSNVAKSAKEKARAKMSKLPPDSFKKMNAKKVYEKNEIKEKAIKQFNKKIDEPLKKKDKIKSVVPASDIIVPAEFDESQAVVISWPSYAFDENGDWLDVLLPGIGILWINETTYYFKDIAGYIADIFEDSPYPEVWANLANAIQQECEVWIRLSSPEDTTDLKNWMSNRGTPLYNYRFFHDPNGENAFWMRDFGPYGIYSGNQDSLAFVDMTYYPDRVIDNGFPTFLAGQLNIPIFHSNVETEGGNYMNDSWGRNFYSDVIYESNQDSEGPIFIDDSGNIEFSYKEPMSISQVDADMKQYLRADTTTILPKLWCDGGTGHIDLYLKFINDETLITPEFPNVFNNSNFWDYNIVKTNQNTISKLKSSYNRSYSILKMPVPTSDNGKYNATDCFRFNNDPRNYINGLIVNKSFIVPIYSNETSGNKNGDNEAIELLKNYFPGYNIVGIDSRLLTPMGGAIHCITTQIPADNPIRIWHPSITGFQKLESEYSIIAKLRNRSGINTAICKWKKNFNGEWNTLNLDLNDSLYSNFIPSSNFTISDTIYYFLEVTSNNGKTVRKPIVAPDGCFSFYFSESSSVATSSKLQYSLYPPQPNPSSLSTNIKIDVPEYSHIKLSIFNMLGNEIEIVLNDDLNEGTYTFSLKTNKLTSGVYFVRMLSGNGIVHTQKLIVE
ncbi:MAG TPA: agmatine deiminase family protein [Candidatus Kapabacteria bacterium]|nr:agmatine deiminase family protein [Candidatus Kapabacteria bacterium]